MKVAISLVGTSPMLMHNVQLADPRNEWAAKIREYTSKRKKTEDDLAKIEELEWYGGLYLFPGIFEGPGIKTESLRKCFISAARAVKLGKAVERALLFESFAVPVCFDGPRNLALLYKDTAFVNRSIVRVSTNRVVRIRPQFPAWEITAHALMLDDAINFDDMARIIEFAGQAEGIGDNRVNGYGRFTGKVIPING